MDDKSKKERREGSPLMTTFAAQKAMTAIEQLGGGSVTHLGKQKKFRAIVFDALEQ